MGEGFNTDFVQKAVEETPYTKLSARDFLGKWCEINDSISPVFIKREAWGRKEEILKKTTSEFGGSFHLLYLPKDLHLWEMVDVIEAVDNETFKRRPELKGKGVEKIKGVAGTFKKAGVYINENINILEEGKDIAQDLSKKFFNYGLSLEARVRKEGELIPRVVLDENDKRKLDKWFLGEEAYQRRMERLGSNPKQEDIDNERKRLFKGYFKALSREGSKGKGEKPWEQSKGPIQKIQEATRKGVVREIKAPRSELGSSIFRRGVEKLRRGMGFDKLLGVLTELREKREKDLAKMTDIDLRNLRGLVNIKELIDYWSSRDYESLYEALSVDKMKLELERFRSRGDVAEVSMKELEIARRIRYVVSRYPYALGSSNPSSMVESQFVNCVGASILGGSLLDEIGINYMVVNRDAHVATVLFTTDGKAYWQDFLIYNKGKYKELTPEELRFGEKGNFYEPEIGVQLAILHNTGNYFLRIGRVDEAIEAYRQALDIDPKYVEAQYGLGLALSRTNKDNKYEEAVRAFERAIDVDPQYAVTYITFGNVLNKLGRNKEALQAYKTFVSLWKGEQSFIDRVNQQIRNLEELINNKEN